MAIYTPGKRDRHNKMGSGSRSAVAILSLTAMVDLFTVLVIFLLMNYRETGEVIDIPKGVELPTAYSVKELKPANVVVVSDTEVRLNQDLVMEISAVRASDDWMLNPLKIKMEELIAKGEEEKRALGTRLRTAVGNIRKDEKDEEEIDRFRKITIQADKELDFLTLKKVMYTVTEAGAYEINFAVLKEDIKE